MLSGAQLPSSAWLRSAVRNPPRLDRDAGNETGRKCGGRKCGGRPVKGVPALRLGVGTQPDVVTGQKYDAYIFEGALNGF